jgi:hypothetical protein
MVEFIALTATAATSGWLFGAFVAGDNRKLPPALLLGIVTFLIVLI